MITVVTSTIGRLSLLKLAQSLSTQNIKVFHLILWDNKRVDNGINPYDKRLDELKNYNYNIFHYDIKHPIFLHSSERIDNHMRIIGISMATTKFITLIDDDCWIENNWFKNAIYNCEKNKLDYCFCRRYLWDNNNNKLGIDNYESIGIVNKFGYNLMETNSIIFNNNIKDSIIMVTLKYNFYGHDRYLAKYLIENFKGYAIIEPYLNQITPDFLLEFHNKNIINM